MPDGLKQIGMRLQEFRDQLAWCRDKNSTMADFQDAYTRLYRIVERFEAALEVRK